VLKRDFPSKMENYLPLLEKIVSELVTAKRNNENNLAAGKIVNFKVSSHSLSACGAFSLRILTICCVI